MCSVVALPVSALTGLLAAGPPSHGNVSMQILHVHLIGGSYLLAVYAHSSGRRFIICLFQQLSLYSGMISRLKSS